MISRVPKARRFLLSALVLAICAVTFALILVEMSIDVSRRLASNRLSTAFASPALPLRSGRRSSLPACVSRRLPGNLPSMNAYGPGRSILVFGGGSTLGKEVVSQFGTGGWRVYTLDYYDASVECGGVNGCEIPAYSADPISLALPAGAPPRTQVQLAEKCLSGACAGKFDVVLNATLGFAAAGLKDDDLFEAWDYMHRTSVESSLVTARLASLFLAENGMLALLGSVAALAGTRAPRLLGFGMAKAAVHQMVRLLAGTVGTELPAGVSVVGLVPEVLDTPLHRAMNNGVSAENWTPCDAVAGKLLKWANEPESRPPNSSLVAVATSAKSEKDSEAHHALEHRFRLIQDSSFVLNTQL